MRFTCIAIFVVVEKRDKGTKSPIGMRLNERAAGVSLSRSHKLLSHFLQEKIWLLLRYMWVPFNVGVGNSRYYLFYPHTHQEAKK